jgi:hypothetical protein
VLGLQPGRPTHPMVLVRMKLNRAQRPDGPRERTASASASASSTHGAHDGGGGAGGKSAGARREDKHPGLARPGPHGAHHLTTPPPHPTPAKAMIAQREVKSRCNSTACAQSPSTPRDRCINSRIRTRTSGTEPYVVQPHEPAVDVLSGDQEAREDDTNHAANGCDDLAKRIRVRYGPYGPVRLRE